MEKRLMDINTQRVLNKQGFSVRKWRKIAIERRLVEVNNQQLSMQVHELMGLCMECITLITTEVVAMKKNIESRLQRSANPYEHR